MSRLVGLDLGPAGDYTALAVLDWSTLAGVQRSGYALRHLKRYPLGTPYPTIIDDVRELLRTPEMRGSLVAVDKTGVGQAVMRLFEDELSTTVTCKWCRVMITNGSAKANNDGRLLVTKLELVGTLQVLLQTRRLQVAKALPEAQTLVRELETYRFKAPAQSDDVLEWREGPQDDLVFAVALAAWIGERALRGS